MWARSARRRCIRRRPPATSNPALRAHFLQAATKKPTTWPGPARLDELGARPSLLNPLWYAGAFGLGLLAGRMGDR
jgi:ubiquinone biosynthesis monooxygenase Coq7